MNFDRHVNYKYLSPADTNLAMKMLGRAAYMGLLVEPVGSRSIEGAAGSPSDLDYLVLDRAVDRKTFSYWLGRNGFEEGGSRIPGQHFTSYKKGKVNFIVTSSEDFYKKFLSANTVAKVHGVKNKEDRITVFGHIMGKGHVSKEEYEYIIANGSSKGYTEAVPF